MHESLHFFMRASLYFVLISVKEEVISGACWEIVVIKVFMLGKSNEKLQMEVRCLQSLGRGLEFPFLSLSEVLLLQPL